MTRVKPVDALSRDRNRFPVQQTNNTKGHYHVHPVSGLAVLGMVQMQKKGLVHLNGLKCSTTDRTVAEFREMQISAILHPSVACSKECLYKN